MTQRDALTELADNALTRAISPSNLTMCFFRSQYGLSATNISHFSIMD
jgi:hypothetical protein